MQIFFTDSAYTERYMGLPNVTDNYKGYEEAEVSKKATEIKDKMFYLIHGTADDNVHLQQSMALVKALTEAGTLFRQQVSESKKSDYISEGVGLNSVKGIRLVISFTAFSTLVNTNFDFDEKV